MRDCVNSLLTAAMYAAPDAGVQSGFTRLVNDMREHHETDLAISIALSGAIYTGLRHGNWPGQPYKLSEKEKDEQIAAGYRLADNPDDHTGLQTGP